MIFVDSNVPMYLAGAPHPNREKGIATLEFLTFRRERCVTSVEVFQELIHRYVAINRRDAIANVFQVLEEMVDDIFPIVWEDMLEAQAVALSYTDLSARDALHVAVMKRRGISQIFSFDSDFDSVPGISRLPAPIGKTMR